MDVAADVGPNIGPDIGPNIAQPGDVAPDIDPNITPNIARDITHWSMLGPMSGPTSTPTSPGWAMSGSMLRDLNWRLGSRDPMFWRCQNHREGLRGILETFRKSDRRSEVVRVCV